MKKGDGPARGDLIGEIRYILERHEHDDGPRVSLGESPGGFEAVHLGHVDLHQNEIRAIVVRVPERLCAGCCIGERLKPSRCYHASGGAAKSRLVIDDHDSDAGGSVPFHGGPRRGRCVQSPTARYARQPRPPPQGVAPAPLSYAWAHGTTGAIAQVSCLLWPCELWWPRTTFWFVRVS